MFLRPLVLILFALALASPAHAESAPGIKVPEIPPLPRAANLKIEEYKLFRAMADGAAATLIPELHFKDPIATPQAGETTSYGVAVGADLAAAFAAQMRGDAPAALTALDAAEAAAAGDSRTLFEIAMLRTQIHITTGQSDAAEAELARAEQFEIETFNTNVNSRALLGEARLWAGDFKHAINYLAQVAVATRDWRLPTEYATVPENLGEVFNMTTAQLRSYSSLAAAYMLLEDFEQALVWARRAEAAAADIFSVTTHPFYRLVVPFHADGYYGRALNLAVLGAVLLIVKDDRAGAKRAFASVHALLDAAGLATPKISADALHAQALLQAGLLDEAELIAGRAAAEANRRGLPDLVWRIEALQGEALLADGRAEEAEAAFERAQAAIELVSGALATDRAKRRFGIGKDDVTTRLVDFAIAKGDLAKAFDILERGRARAFVDMLADRTVAAGREAELSEQIRGIDGELRNLRFLAGSPAGAAEDFLDQQSDLTAKRDELAAELRARDPELADVLSVSHSEVGDIQAALTPGDVLAYGLPARGDALVRILLITRDAIRIEQLGASDSGFAKVLKAFRLAVEESADAGRQQKMTDGLGRLLNVAAWGARRTLYVVPSGQLFFIPWGALAIDAPVAVLPTGGWMLRNRREAGAPDAVVVGDPQFFDEMPQLPGARREAERIGATYGVEPLLGEAATEEKLRGEVGGGVRVLHIASHAEFHASRPLQSALILSGDGAAAKLTAEAIYRRPLPARLVVLSACETGAGRVAAGDDLLGLPRSFYLGGATTVINSLWPVSDEGTLAFMTAFHDALGAGDVGAAWLAARDTLRRAGYPPYIYGAFIVGGSLSL